MTESRADPRRTRLVPEVVQTSDLDCGPASLAALLEGCGVPTSAARLREACQTDVDGTSIDALGEVAHLARYPGKAEPCIARAGRLDRAIESVQPSLVRKPLQQIQVGMHALVGGLAGL